MIGENFLNELLVSKRIKAIREQFSEVYNELPKCDGVTDLDRAYCISMAIERMRDFLPNLSTLNAVNILGLTSDEPAYILLELFIDCSKENHPLGLKRSGFNS